MCFRVLRRNLLITLVFITNILCQENPVSSIVNKLNPDETVKGLYNMVTFTAGNLPNWDTVRTLFIPEAVVVLRTSREGMTVFNLDGFIEDFKKFIKNARLENIGFTEKVIKISFFEYENIANASVLYEASIPNSKYPPQQGLDNFQLMKKKGKWLITAIVNDIIAKEKPLPEKIFGKE